MPFPWIEQAQFEARLGADAVRRIYDDDNDGIVDAASIGQLLQDACAFIGGALGPQYTVDALTTMDTIPPEVTRLSLDVATAYAARRNPEVLRRDWEAELRAVERECERIRKGQANLGVAATPPEPAAQNSGNFYLETQGIESSTQPGTFTRDGFGGF